MGWPTVELAELPGLEVKDVNVQLANGVRPQLLAALAKRCGVAWRLPNLIGFPRRSLHQRTYRQCSPERSSRSSRE
jgi:hypothetical protein